MSVTKDEMKGLYKKYQVTKTDGSPVDPLAEYFVLRIDTDIHARRALKAYAESIRVENPALARETKALLFDREPTLIDQQSAEGEVGEDIESVIIWIDKKIDEDERWLDQAKNTYPGYTPNEEYVEAELAVFKTIKSLLSRQKQGQKNE